LEGKQLTARLARAGAEASVVDRKRDVSRATKELADGQERLLQYAEAVAYNDRGSSLIGCQPGRYPQITCDLGAIAQKRDLLVGERAHRGLEEVVGALLRAAIATFPVPSSWCSFLVGFLIA
jgi:NAD(P)-dependent dehydrogenase (short-subunit alcohol dehydrogenase family)